MKKSVFTKFMSLTLAAAIALSFSGFIYADETGEGDPDDLVFEEVTIEEDAVPDVDLDSDELAEHYIMDKLAGENRPIAYKFDYANQLSGYNRTAFDYLYPYMAKIASGELTETQITIPRSVLEVSFTNEELGIEDFNSLTSEQLVALALANNPISKLPILNALMYSCPYEMYWYDRPQSADVTFGLGKSSTQLVLTNYTFKFTVARKYQDGDIYKVNKAYSEALANAASTINSIIENNANKDDYNKLLAYNNEICSMVDYDHDAAGTDATNYGNPWQLVYVFDGDPSTKVVCEGYAKAFQYLCDRSDFRSDEVYCISVKGNMQGGGHEWNIVHMDDGKNYLVDTTNSDGNASVVGGAYTLLFLVGANSGSVADGYNIKIKNRTSVWKYEYWVDSTSGFYNEDALALENADYDPNKQYTLSMEYGSGGIAALSKTSAKAGDLITISINPLPGYYVDKIEVNGKSIGGFSFYMPGRDVNVSVQFKKYDYPISLTTKEGGSASAPATAQYGEAVTVKVTPNTGYKFEKLVVNGTTINDNTFVMSATNAIVYVYFEKINYNLSVNPTTGGSVKLSSATATYGEDVTVTATPDTGYAFYQIKVNGTPIQGNSFKMPAEDVTLTVEFRKIDYAITVNAGEGGTASAPASAQYGDEVSFSAQAYTGYMIASFTVNGTSIGINKFRMPAEPVTIVVTFEKINYPVTVNAGEGGQATASASAAHYQDLITVNATPDIGYALYQIKVNGDPIEGNTFNMPSAKVTVEVTFVKIDYTVSVTAGEDGEAEVSKTTANYGDKITVTATPELGYEVDKILVNDAEINGTTFDMPAGNARVEVTFKKALYSISLTCSEGGGAGVSIPEGYYGDEVSIPYTAYEGYHLDRIVVNGVTIDGTTFTIPAGNVTIRVIFEKDKYDVTVADTVNGTASVSAESAAWGSEVKVNAVPAKSYEIDKITFTPEGGEAVDITNVKQFTMPKAAVTVNVTFKKAFVPTPTATATPTVAPAAEPTAAAKATATPAPKATANPSEPTSTPAATSKPDDPKATGTPDPAKVSLGTVTIDKTSANLVCGKTVTLKATVKGSSNKVTWKSSNAKIASVDASGKVTAKQAGAVTITATAGGASSECKMQVLFKDVTNSKDFWYEPTYYLVNKDVVKGYDNQTNFKPTNDCTRAQMVTFLWRLQGEPAPKTNSTSFTDIKSSDYFFKPVLWAVEKGITTGVSKTKFDPQGVCTRAQTVTFLWRMAKKPAPKTTANKFTDVKKGDYFYNAVLWAAEKKIVAGYDDNTFRPQGKCLRRQMVTFLYKYDKFVNGKG